MQVKLKPRIAPWLFATGLALGAGVASASNGFTVTHEQESLVKVGMSAGEVQQALGQPARTATLRNQSGPTWTYDVAASWDHAVFQIDFDGAGKVASVDQRELPVE